jgi:hypothetical protein
MGFVLIGLLNLRSEFSYQNILLLFPLFRSCDGVIVVANIGLCPTAPCPILILLQEHAWPQLSLNRITSVLLNPNS